MNVLWKVGVFMIGLALLILAAWVIYSSGRAETSPMWARCSRVPKGYAVIVTANVDLEDVKVVDPWGNLFSDEKDVKKGNDEVFLVPDIEKEFILVVTAKTNGESIKKAVNCGYFYPGKPSD